MKSRISFFDWATAKKDLTRFAPLWVLYTFILFITVLPSVTGAGFLQHPLSVLNESIMVFSACNSFYALLTASLLFGDLFNSRLCNGLHAMPVTRTARFGSHVCAGLAFSFVPNLLVALLMMPSLEQFWFASLLWFVAVCGQYLFFFSVSVFSAMCTGSRFAAVVIYGIINYFSLIIDWFITLVFLPEMPGVSLDSLAFSEFSPVVRLLIDANYMRYTVNYKAMVSSQATFDGLGDSWLYLGILTVIAILLLAAALLLYRRRKLESAGDFIATPWLKPIFLVLYSLCCGAFFSIFSLSRAVLLFPGLLIGFFTGKMLLARTTRVFQKKNFLQAAIFAGVLLVMLWTARADLFGIVRYVPEVEDVEQVSVSNYYLANQSLDAEAQKQLIHEIHTLAVEDPCDGTCGERHTYLGIKYRLRSGRTIERQYYICDGSQADQLLDGLIKDD